ncbi:hypothetical protein ACFL6C_14095 [Myxococcota bacterium]
MTDASRNTARTEDSESITTDEFFQFLTAMVLERRAALAKHITVAFAVKGIGYYLIDTGAKGVLSLEWRDDADVGIVCNEKTLSDMLLGRFDYEHPEPGHLFLWGGDAEALRSMGALLKGGQSAVATRLQQTRR